MKKVLITGIIGRDGSYCGVLARPRLCEPRQSFEDLIDEMVRADLDSLSQAPAGAKNLTGAAG